MPGIENVLILQKIEGRYSQIEHHAIAAKMKAMSDEWDKIELETGKRPPDAYNYGVGLVMERDLIISALPEKLEELGQKIAIEISAVGMR